MAILYQGLEDALSRERFASYLILAGNNREKAVGLYLSNIQLSAAFYVSLNFLEIALRNRIHLLLTDSFQEDTWFRNPKVILTFSQEKQLAEAEKQVKEQEKTGVTGDIIAKLPFGFWTGMFSPKWDLLWRSVLHKIPVYKTKENRTRQKWSERLMRIRNIRNRIAHYEPIVRKDNLKEIHADIINMIGWLSPVSAEACGNIDSFESVFSDYQRILVAAQAA